MLWPGLGMNYHWDRDTWDDVEEDIQHISTFCSWIRPGIPDYRSDISTGYLSTVLRFCELARKYNLKVYWGLCNKNYFGPSTWQAYVDRSKELLLHVQQRGLVDIYDAGNEEELKIDNITVVSVVRLNRVVTVTLNAPHEVEVDNQIQILNAIQSQYNGVQTVTSVPSPTTLTYEIATAPVSPATGSIQFRSMTVPDCLQRVNTLVAELKQIATVPVAYSVSGHGEAYPFYAANGIGQMDYLMFNAYDRLVNFQHMLTIYRALFGSKFQLSEWGVSRQSRNGINVYGNQAEIRRETEARLNIIKQIGIEIYMWYAYAEGSEGFCLKDRNGYFSDALMPMIGVKRKWWVSG